MSRYLLDSNVLIRHLRRRERVTSLLGQWADDEVSISVVTRLEVLAGMLARQQERTMEVLESLISVPVTVDIADQAGRWIYQYARRGIQLSFPDALIAATALAHDLTLVTTNSRHFPMPELRVEGLL